ncbi:MAG: class I SAM-dependent methyltransferase [Anaerolineales bacterium]
MQSFYPESRFGGFSDIDGTIAFYNRVNSLLLPSFTVLDVGCGRGAYGEDPIAYRKNLRILKGKAAKVIGIDVDERAQRNPFINEFHLVDGGLWPIETNTIDLVLCDYVLEHIRAVHEFFGEIHRLLKPGGYICVRTANRWSYFALAARLIPNKWHSKVVSIVQDGRKEEDVFPTVYKCNSIRQLRGIMNDNDFQSVVYGYSAEPAYLSFSRLAYFIGSYSLQFVPGVLKPAIFGFGRLREKRLPMTNPRPFLHSEV